MKTRRLANFLDDILNIRSIEDDSLNGLQLENHGTFDKVALAVDASATSIHKAKEIDTQFLFVHHGLFWNKPVSLTGFMYQRIRLLMESDIALYAAHLPLDLHPELGNNAQICKVMGWPVEGDFGEYHGSVIGKEVRFPESLSLSKIVDQVRQNFGVEPVVWAFGPDRIKHLGCISGGAIGMINQAIGEGMDTYLTGEPKHDFYWTAKESCINVIFSGHYATETLGVEAVGKEIEKTLGIETTFIDLPTGL